LTIYAFVVMMSVNMKPTEWVGASATAGWSSVGQLAPATCFMVGGKLAIKRCIFSDLWVRFEIILKNGSREQGFAEDYIIALTSAESYEAQRSFELLV
jgi:hypothetical protein